MNHGGTDLVVHLYHRHQVYRLQFTILHNNTTVYHR
jgi:hypothetical protein